MIDVLIALCLDLIECDTLLSIIKRSPIKNAHLPI